MRTSEPRLRTLIDAMAAFYQLPRFSYRGEDYSPAELLEGLVIAESSGDPRARRYEPHQDRIADGDRPGLDDVGTEDDASYGLTQVMGSNWRRILGLHRDTPIAFDNFAFDVTFALRAGIVVLKNELHAVFVLRPHAPEAEQVVRALCRYNGGPTGDALVDLPQGGQDLRRREYVDRVARCAGLARADRQANGWPR